jgi:hypothetical protein
VVLEVVEILEFKISTLRMLAPYLLTTPLSLLASNQMLVIEIVVHNSRAAIYKGALFTREPLITDVIKTLGSVKEQKESIRARQRFVFCFERLGLYG